MSLELCILASGSSGNCTVVRTPAGVVLIDAGIGPRIAARRLLNTGVSVAEVSAICLTHLDADHFSSTWLSTIVSCRIRVFVHRPRADDFLRLAKEATDDGCDALGALLHPFGEEAFEPVEGLRMRPVSLAHDREGSHGFLAEGFGGRIGYATDLGRVPDTLVESFEGVDVLALESNYDAEMELSSARPAFLKKRIMGGAGHLSNEQALAAVRAILDRAEARKRRLPEHIVLLHRSRQCNCPRLLRRLFSSDARIAPRLTLADQYHATGWLRIEKNTRPLIGEQLFLYAAV